MRRPAWFLGSVGLLVSVARVAAAQTAGPLPSRSPSDEAAAPSSAENAAPAPAPPSEAAPETGNPLPRSPAVSFNYRPRHEPLPDLETETRWYGYQNILVDLGGIVLAVVAADQSSGGLAGVSVATFLLGSPIVHFAHGNVGTGFGSLALRVGAPLAGAGIGCVADGSHGEWGCFGGLAVGALLGGATAMIVDYAALAYEDVPKMAVGRPRFTPSFSLASGSGHLVPSVGLGGTF